MFSRAVRSPYPDVSPPETMLMTWRMGKGSLVTSWPATRACPEVGSSSVARILMRVVLPAPLGPSIPNSSPSSILRETLSSAVTGPTLSSTSSSALRRRFFLPAKIRVRSRVSTAYDMGDWVHSLPDRAQRQKMNMIRGFVTDPDILFLDEPTLGLDVNAARVIREYVTNWVRGQKGKTVLLTTHYMAEADQMCDRIAIIDKGKILACDTPENLKRMIRTETTFRLEVDAIRDLTTFSTMQGVKNFSHKDDIAKNRSFLTFILEDEGPVAEILSTITLQGKKVHSLQKSEPTLEDVFISMVGRGFE